MKIVRKLDNVPIYSSEIGFFTELEVIRLISPHLLAELQIIASSRSPIDIKNQTGWYHKLFKVAWVKFGDRPSNEIKRSLLHEVGHHIWGMLKEGDRTLFAANTKKRCRGGCNDWSIAEERFADAIAFYYLNNPVTRAEIKITKICQQLLTCYQLPE